MISLNTVPISVSTLYATFWPPRTLDVVEPATKTGGELTPSARNPVRGLERDVVHIMGFFLSKFGPMIGWGKKEIRILILGLVRAGASYGEEEG